MTASKPVVVYGASGYTGRLVCEYLREYRVPFIAAGRDKARIAEALEPGRRHRCLEQAIIGAIGPVMGQLFGQTEAPMMISTMPPKDHLRADGTLATERFASAGRPTPLVTVAIMDDQGSLLPAGQRGAGVRLSTTQRNMIIAYKLGATGKLPDTVGS
jgi:acyl-CoA synthetase (AMP-forming)/AMP-acid ligase II